jgi:type I restriction enzyme S subunit
MISFNKIPEYWQVKKLGSFCEIVMGQSPPSSTYNTDRIGLPFFQGKAEFTELYPVVRKWCSIPNKVAEPLDILISVRAPVGSSNIANQKCCIGRGLAALRYPDCNKYIFYYFRLIEQKLDELGTGSTFKAISSTTLRNVEIPLPPLPEQKKIVEKIEELFSGLDSGVASLKKAKAQIRLYRQSVLASAFSGKLLTQSAERQAHSELPTGWKWVKLGEIVEDIEMAQKKNKKTEDEFIYYDIGGINNKTNTIESFKKYKWKKAPSRARQIVKKGDVLFSTVRTYLKNIALLNFDFDSQIASTGFCIIRPDSIQLISGYIFYYSLSRQFLEPLNALQTGSSYPAVRDNDVFNQLIPLAPFNLQTQIVEEIEKRFSEADNLEKAIDESLAKSETLRQSILKKAFEGRLV